MRLDVRMIQRILVAFVATLLAVPCALAAPDLIVQSVTLDPSSPPAGSGTIDMVFANIGPDDVDLSFTEYTNYTVKLDGVECDSGTINDLVSGQSNAGSTASCNPGSAGPHTITVTIDSDGDVEESNEANNVATTSFTWSGPDLVVTSVTLDPAVPNVTEGTFTIVFENIGPYGVDTGVTNKTNYAVAVDGVECASSFIFDLGSGSTNEESVSGCGASTPGPHTVTVTIDSENDVAETNEGNNVWTQTFTWQGGPDLIVTDITLDPAEPKVGEGTLTGTIANVGNQGTGLLVSINVTMFIDGVECDTGLLIGGLDNADTATKNTSSCWPTLPGEHVVRYEVDTDDDVIEADESNNFLEKTLAWSAPDLVVTSVTLDPAVPNVTEGTFTITFENIGPWEVDTPLADKTNYTVAIDGVECDSGFIFDLAAGETNVETTSSCGAMTPGAHVVTVTIDSGNEVVELSEANNTLVQTFSWQGGPDLIITDIELDPAAPKVGTGTLTATIANVGNQGTDLFVNINVTMYLDGVECDTGLVIGGLGEGSDTTEETGSCNPETPGEHTIRFEVDTDDDVVEADESNNSFEKTFVWTAPDLVITGITASATPLEPGESNTFTAIVANQGPVDTDLLVAINLVMYLDGQECDTGLVIAGLNAGATAEEATSSCNATTWGPHTLRFDVDTDEDVVEQDETNNTFEQVFVFCGPSELCNGYDDDCDGETDEGMNLGDACDGPDADQCANGTLQCAEDGGVACDESGDAEPELCDGADNDCDGAVDEDFLELGEACDPDGSCADGVWTCSDDGGIWCAPGTAETCNGVDDDCDGETDEDFPTVGMPCALGVGACRAVGTMVCGAGDGECDAEPATPDAEETCGDGMDNDCDGIVDNGCACVEGEFLVCGIETGACSQGTLPCVDGAFASTCDGALKAVEETCGNGIDDDCDGSVDEGCACDTDSSQTCDTAPGACAGSTQYCVDGQWGPCASESAPSQEECNGIDDDCDGVTDDGCTCVGDTQPCEPAPDSCADYVASCEPDSVWSPCAPVPGSEDPDCADGTDTGGEDTGDTSDTGGDTTDTGGDDTGDTGDTTDTGGGDTTDTGGQDTTDTGGEDTGGDTTGGDTTDSTGGDTAGTVDGDVPGPIGASSDGGCVASPSSPGGAPVLLLLVLGVLAVQRRRQIA
ncbi:MAG: subtilase family serine protease [Myxococcota bacterium]|jgi:subtilase family serine protease